MKKSENNCYLIQETLVLIITGIFIIFPSIVFAQTIIPAQPGAATTYRFADVYTLPGGEQRSVVLNPEGVEVLIRGGTDAFLTTLRAAFPGIGQLVP